ncbi:MAG: phosphoribosylformylglycinamidine synthase I [Sedimentisphaerales bacterium]|nr:phosphoribosylformylglycinamidine synthase I [Sedimentisphaerales bacterium]
MAKIKVLVMRTAGTNCDQETCQAFEMAGASTEKLHVNRLIENPKLISQYQILALPGGFSYGDDIASGKILANQLLHHFIDQVKDFISGDKLVIGICNGFQVLVKTGLLPGKAVTTPNCGIQQATLIHNDSGKFEARWAYLQPATSKCVFIDPKRRLYLPVAHGEGKVCFADQDVYNKVVANDQVAFRYVDADGNFGDYPVNPNGSTDHIAGLTDDTGRVLGLMPHPERFIHKTHHPRWTREEISNPDGMTIFDNAVKYFK